MFKKTLLGTNFFRLITITLQIPLNRKLQLQNVFVSTVQCINITYKLY